MATLTDTPAQRIMRRFKMHADFHRTYYGWSLNLWPDGSATVFEHKTGQETSYPTPERAARAFIACSGTPDTQTIIKAAEGHTAAEWWAEFELAYSED